MASSSNILDAPIALRGVPILEESEDRLVGPAQVLTRRVCCTRYQPRVPPGWRVLVSGFSVACHRLLFAWAQSLYFGHLINFPVPSAMRPAPRLYADGRTPGLALVRAQVTACIARCGAFVTRS